MRGKLPKRAVLLALWGVLGCGSTSDLMIGAQAEAGLTVEAEAEAEAEADAQPEAEMDARPEVRPDAREAGVVMRVCSPPPDASSIERDAALDASLDGELDGGEPDLDARADARDAISSDADCIDPVLCAELKGALVHRYSFNGTGTRVLDSVGGLHGTVVNTQLRGDGTLFLAGHKTDASQQYVDLPNGIIRTMTNATFEAWVTWYGCERWQRIFDFGNSDPAGAATSLYLTPDALPPAATNMLAAFKRAGQSGADETRAATTNPLTPLVRVQVAVVVDDTNNEMTVYENGELKGTTPFNDSLSLLNDINNWLGRSQYFVDVSFYGVFHEFRIYNVALSEAALKASVAGGPDAGFLN